jgi:hypothetical protein
MKLEEISRDWRPPAALGFSSMRPVRLTGDGIALCVLAAVFVAGGLVLGGVLWTRSGREETNRQLLNEQGAITKARVLRVWRSGGEDSKRQVRYRFAVDGRDYISSKSVPSRIWRTLKAGADLDVRYVREDPSINQPVEWNARVTPAFVVVLVPVMFLGLAGLLAWVVRRQWRLLAEGRPAPAMVTSIRRRDKTLRVSYEFRLLNGAIQKGRCSVSSKSVPGVGTLGCALYDPENPRRSELYPMSMVRLLV